MPYPATLPLTEATEAFAIIKAGEFATCTPELGYDLWQVQGYVQKILLGDPNAPVVFGATADEDAAVEAAFDKLHGELAAQVLGIVLVPSRIKRPHVAHQFIDAHPAGQIAFFREIADAREDAHGIGDRISRGGFQGFQQARIQRLRRLPSQLIHGTTACHREQPGPEVRGRPGEASETGERGEEHLAGDVLGVTRSESVV